MNKTSIFLPARNHLALGRGLFARVKPASFPETQIRYQNKAWAARLGLGALPTDDARWVERFAQFKPFVGSIKYPLALAYHGHQFGVYNPDIGDGRGFLYAQMVDPIDGRLLDFGTKGSGQTPFSRQGDGRLTLKGAIREVLATEMLTALGVNTSKSFSVIETGESLYRHDEPSPTRGAVLTRLSHSHIRIGSFQRLGFFKENRLLERLLRHTARNYFSDRLDAEADSRQLAAEFVAAVAENLAILTASYMAAGFVHGVLNTDNFNVTGESFDYGPWRFLPRLDPNFTAAYFDHQGRYAYGRQPEAAFWALCRLAESLMPFADSQAMEQAVGHFQTRINDAMTQSLCRRLGIAEGWGESERLATHLFTAMRGSDIGFDSVFFDWFGGQASKNRALDSPRKNFYRTPDFTPAVELLQNAPTGSGVDLTHAYFDRTQPITMLISTVESLWEPIASHDDWQEFNDYINSIRLMADAIKCHQ